jgi:hypothetical protein
MCTVSDVLERFVTNYNKIIIIIIVIKTLFKETT